MNQSKSQPYSQYEVTATLTLTYTKTIFGTIDDIAQDLGLEPGNPHHRKVLKKAIAQSLSWKEKQEPMENAIEKIVANHLKQFATDDFNLAIDAEVMK